MTLICNLFAGPCSSKSTVMSAVFSLAKSQHLSCEQIPGCEKEFIYEENFKKLKCQPLILGTCVHRIESLLDKVDFIITDLPLPLNVIYNSQYPDSFNQAVMDIFSTYNNLNFFLERGDDYCTKGRIHSKKESEEIDKKILKLLVKNNIMFFKIKGGFESANGILEVIKNRLMLKPGQKSVSWFKSTMGLL